MTIEELEVWQEEFEAFHAREASLFEHRMQRLLYRVPWDAEAARDRLQRFVIERFGDEEGIGVVDETSFLKKGTHSVGVARQYLGAAGKLENGQGATVLSSAAQGAHVFLDRRLYLPEEWAWNRQRRAEARVPEEVRFETKPEQATAMLLHAWEQGVPMRWVTGDEVYGDSPRLRETIQAHGRFYAAFGLSQHRCVDRAARGGRATRADRWTATARATAGSRGS
jgi:SRSO17 transposase